MFLINPPVALGNVWINRANFFLQRSHYKSLRLLWDPLKDCAPNKGVAQLEMCLIKLATSSKEWPGIIGTVVCAT